MNAGGAMLYTLLRGLEYIFQFVSWLILAWVVLSWILLFATSTSFRWKRPGLYKVLAQLNEFFTRATEPLLRPFRKLLPPWKTGGIDWSPLLLLFVIFLIRTFIAAMMR